MSERCPYCEQRAAMSVEYDVAIGPCPLHDKPRDADDS